MPTACKRLAALGVHDSTAASRQDFKLHVAAGALALSLFRGDGVFFYVLPPVGGEEDRTAGRTRHQAIGDRSD